MQQSELPFLDLSDRHFGISPAIGACYAEAACVCLDRHHSSPISFNLECLDNALVAVAAWPVLDSRTKGAWNNETDTTEQGAYGIAIAAVEIGRGLLAVRRAETQTGADYYLAPHDASNDDLESWFRLEVSGVDRGDASAIRQRLAHKIRQALDGNSNLPALAAVVGFRSKLVVVAAAM